MMVGISDNKSILTIENRKNNARLSNRPPGVIYVKIRKPDSTQVSGQQMQEQTTS